MADVPRPPGLPRCPECSYVGTHAADCLLGTTNEAHWDNVRAVTSTLERSIAERRNDHEFMARLRRNMEKHKDLLDRLADGDRGRCDTCQGWQQIEGPVGGMIDCPACSSGENSRTEPSDG